MRKFKTKLRLVFKYILLAGTTLLSASCSKSKQEEKKEAPINYSGIYTGTEQSKSTTVDPRYGKNTRDTSYPKEYELVAVADTVWIKDGKYTYHYYKRNYPGDVGDVYNRANNSPHYFGFLRFSNDSVFTSYSTFGGVEGSSSSLLLLFSGKKKK